jgi:hypothetical protein
MITQEEKFTIKVNDKGVLITGEEGQRLSLSPVEALMLIDILKAEEKRLKTLAGGTSPSPFKISL